MAAAARGKGQPPKVKTFATNGTTTNGIAADWAAAEEWGNVEGETDFAGLTWEQKEKVIRLLFAKMNGFESTKAKKSLPPIQKRPLSSKSSSNSAVALSEMESLHERAMSSQNDDHGGATFITQTVWNFQNFIHFIYILINKLYFLIRLSSFFIATRNALDIQY